MLLRASSSGCRAAACAVARCTPRCAFGTVERPSWVRSAAGSAAGADDDDSDDDQPHETTAFATSSTGTFTYTSPPPRPLRVERLLANLGYGKRKESTAMIKRGRVTHAVTGKRLGIGEKALPTEVLLDGEALDPGAPLSVVLHKPVGYVVSSPEDENIGDPVVYDLLPYRFGRRRPFLSCVGRLDKDTSGLLLLTDDGQLLHRIISPHKGIWKRYIATLAQPLVGRDAVAVGRRFASGAMLLPGDRLQLLPARLAMLGDAVAEVQLAEGRYHQIRRMFAAVGHEVVGLHRDTIGGLSLGGLKEGEWRYATVADIASVFEGPSTAKVVDGVDGAGSVEDAGSSAQPENEAAGSRSEGGGGGAGGGGDGRDAGSAASTGGSGGDYVEERGAEEDVVQDVLEQAEEQRYRRSSQASLRRRRLQAALRRKLKNSVTQSADVL